MKDPYPWYSTHSATDDRFSPPQLIAMRDAVWPTGTDTDPCWHPRSFSTARTCYTKAQNGTVAPWRGRVWLNPPWSEPGPWIDLAVRHMRQISLTDPPEAMICVRNDPSTSWWSAAWETADAIAFLSERTRYWQLQADGALVRCEVPTFTTVVFYYGPGVAGFIAQTTAYGHYGVDLRNHSNGRRIPTMAKHTNGKKPPPRHVLDGMLRQTLAAYARAHPDATLIEIYDAIPTADLLCHPLMTLRVRDLWPEAANAMPPAPPRNGTSRRTTTTTKATASAAGIGRVGVPKAKGAPPKEAPKKATNGANGVSHTLKARAEEITAWLGRSGKMEFRASDVMDALGVSRQTALRALVNVGGIRSEGKAKTAKYVVTT